MNFERLATEPLDLPECEAVLTKLTRQFWKGRSRQGNEKGKDTCGCYAKYKINGIYMCRKHAGLYLLDNLEAIIGGN